MKKKKLFLILILIIITSCKKQEEKNLNDTTFTSHLSVEWSNKYANYSMNYPISESGFINTSDGGIALFFSWYNNNESGTCLLKINSNGSTEFNQIYTDVFLGDNYCNIVQTSDNGFLLVGKTSFPIIGKTDADGNLLWTKTMSYDSLISTNDIVQKTDGEFLVLARNLKKLFIFQLNNLGDTIQSAVLKDSILPIGVQMKFNSAGELIIAYKDKINGEWVGHLLAIDQNYQKIWSYDLINSGYNTHIVAFDINSDNSVNFAASLSGGISQVSKIDNSGHLIWQKTIANLYGINDIVHSQSGGFFLSMDNSKQIVKITESGDFLWSETIYIEKNYPSQFGMLITQDNYYYYFGNIISTSGYNYNPVIIKFNEK